MIPESDNRFATTRWSIVLGAGGTVSPADARCALSELCETYWPPLYAFLRRNGASSADAEDTVQGFFASLLSREDLAHVQPERGRFRSFLLASLKHYQANERDKRQALKRGGGQIILSLDAHSAEQRYALEPVDRHTPEALFERAWARTVLDRVWSKLRADYEAAGKADRFDVLSPYLAGEHGASYGEAAAKLGTTEGAVKVAIHRLRREFGSLLRSEIAETVAAPNEVDGEITSLFEALQR